MKLDDLRLIGSAQTNTVMDAELIRVAQRALHRRPAKPRREGTGQLIYPYDAEMAGVATRYLRTPTRVLHELWQVSAQRLDPLFDAVSAAMLDDDRQFWGPNETFAIEVRALANFAAGRGQVLGTIKNAIEHASAQRGCALRLDTTQPRHALVVRETATGELVIGRDLGAGSLSHRGWRSRAGDAPLREHLAAVLLMLARFHPKHDILVDPMCGAGTIPIEAILMARGEGRPGVLGLAAAELGDVKAPALFADAVPLVIGCDIDLPILAKARDNARDAAAETVVWQRTDMSELTPELIAEIAHEQGREPTPGLILSNPPYGERLTPGDMRLFYGMMADTLQRFHGWRAGFIVGNREFEQIMQREFGRPAIKKPLANGAIPSYFYLYDI